MTFGNTGFIIPKENEEGRTAVKPEHYKLIALLLVLAMVLGFVGSCVAYKPLDPGDAVIPPTFPTEPEATVSTLPSEP